MPIYEYRCKICGNKFDKLRPMSETGLPGQCHKCGAWCEQQVSVPCVISDDLGTTYMDPTFGSVHSKSELRLLEKQAGLRPVDPGESKNIRRVREYREQKEDTIREEAIGKTVTEMCI